MIGGLQRSRCHGAGNRRLLATDVGAHGDGCANGRGNLHAPRTPWSHAQKWGARSRGLRFVPEMQLSRLSLSTSVVSFEDAGRPRVSSPSFAFTRVCSSSCLERRARIGAVPRRSVRRDHRMNRHDNEHHRMTRRTRSGRGGWRRTGLGRCRQPTGDEDTRPSEDAECHRHHPPLHERGGPWAVFHRGAHGRSVPPPAAACPHGALAVL